MLTDSQMRIAAKKFAAEWNGRGYEKGETHAFWINLLRTVSGVAEPEVLKLADLPEEYHRLSFLTDTRKAHQANDKAVMKAYGYAPNRTEPEIVADLMKRYLELTAR